MFGLLTQEFGRFELSIRDSLELGVGRRSGGVKDEEMWSALEFAHLRRVVSSLPNGLDTVLGEQWGGSGMSGGQWQRLAIARLALRDSPVWVLDEPTASLDAEVEQQVFDTLRREASSRITLVVTHRASTLAKMDRIHVVSAGRIVQAGSFSELVTDTNGEFYRLFHDQLVGDI